MSLRPNRLPLLLPPVAPLPPALASSQRLPPPALRLAVPALPADLLALLAPAPAPAPTLPILRLLELQPSLPPLLTRLILVLLPVFSSLSPPSVRPSSWVLLPCCKHLPSIDWGSIMHSSDVLIDNLALICFSSFRFSLFHHLRTGDFEQLVSHFLHKI